MGNIKNYTFDRLRTKLSNHGYWDFTLNTDAIKELNPYNIIGGFDFSQYDTLSLIPDFNSGDFDSNDFYTEYGIISDGNGWSDAISSNFSASTYGLTGLDNMSIIYDKSTDDVYHTDLLSALTGSTLIHTSEDTKLLLKQVSGATEGHIYPLDITVDSGSTGNYLTLEGGFYQGYYKLDGFDYQTLPTRYQDGYTIDLWLRPNFGNYRPSNTLNETYPNNEGFFFYNGTRAENKFWNIFSGNTLSACTSGDTHFCMSVKETDVEINNIVVNGEITDISVPLSPPPVDVKLIENQFLIFGRSEGKLCSNEESADGFGRVRADYKYDRDTKHYSRIVRQEQVDFQNQFLTFGRSEGKLCSNEESEDGFGRVRADNDFSGFTQDVTELDKNKDIIDNAIGFRIKSDGSIGYRLLTLSGDCKSVMMDEEYSEPGLVTNNQWNYITVKWINNDTYNECDLIHGEPRKGRLKFYVNSNLLFISKELDEFIPKRLNEIQEKQIGVPYNISLGGGTQGLLESLTFDGQDVDDLGLVIEQNFAGTFIGDISTFNLYDRNLSWCEIKSNYNDKVDIYK